MKTAKFLGTPFFFDGVWEATGAFGTVCNTALREQAAHDSQRHGFHDPVDTSTAQTRALETLTRAAAAEPTELRALVVTSSFLIERNDSGFCLVDG